jgi:hypothetical protein
MFRQCGILEYSDSVVFILECSDSVVFWNVPIVWYFLFFYFILELFRQCGILECSDSVVFILDVPTVWYFGMFRPCGIYFGMFRQCGILECSDSVVFFVFYFILELFRQCGI